MKTFLSESYDDTVSFAENFAKTLPKGTVIGYLGDLGAGKTAFTAGLAKGLGIDSDVSSPTFTICNEYRGKVNVLYHFDMYRVNSWDDLYSTGFFDYLESEAYIAVEWSENIFGALPEDSVIIEIKKKSETSREFKIFNKGETD